MMYQSFLLFIIAAFILSSSFSSFADESVVAKINGTVITERELEDAVSRIIPRSTFHGNVTEERRNEFRQQALDELINRELEYEDAVAKGMKPDRKMVNDQMDSILGRFQTKKEYKKALEQAGMNEDRLRAQVEKDTLAYQAVMKTTTEPAHMSDGALKEYYEKNIEKFKQPESVKLRLISAKDKSKAKAALSRLNGGEDFGKVAAGMSEDSYRVMGGDIGYMHKGMLLQELEDAAFQLNVGEVSGLISAGGNWYIIKAEDKRPAHQVSFDDARAKLKKELETKRAKELMEKWVSDLRAKAKIEVFLKVE